LQLLTESSRGLWRAFASKRFSFWVISMFNRYAQFVAALSLLTLLLLGVSNAHAATLAFDFINDTAVVADPGVGPDARGNVFEFTDGGITLEVTAWADMGRGSLDQTATLTQQSWGLGSCSEKEGDFDTSGCLKSSQLNKNATIDNDGGYDWVLIVFPENVQFDSFTVTPSGNQDKDVTYWTGNVGSAGDVSGLTYAELDTFIGTRVAVNNLKSTADATMIIVDSLGNPVIGNAILIGASLRNGGDRFGLSALTVTAVPLPQASWLMLSALGALVVRKRRAS
jgi:hypothetical protein